MITDKSKSNQKSYCVEGRFTRGKILGQHHQKSRETSWCNYEKSNEIIFNGFEPFPYTNIEELYDNDTSHYEWTSVA